MDAAGRSGARPSGEAKGLLMEIRKAALLVFAGFFTLYLFLMPPALAPYRDTGEMTASAKTLGVSHPTSYPVYILMGHLAGKFPLGNGAYRLTLLSVIAGAAGAAALFLACAPRWGAGAGLCAALLLGLNSTFLSIALVPEMYSFWVLGAVVLLALALIVGERGERRLWMLFAGLYGLLLGNRLDLLLWTPGMLWLALSPGAVEASRQAAGFWAFFAFLAFPGAMIALGSNAPIVLLIAGTAVWLCRGARRGWLLSGLAMGGVGLSVYLYLPIRSAQGPWLDWNHPATLANFLDSLLRSKYGGTLDLLSKSYATGELFGANLKVYGGHLWKNFGAWGLLASVFGCAAALRGDGRRWLGMAALYWWSGPVFLFMANMPPNPHALSIVEPHYLLSDIVLVFWAAEGLGLGWDRLRARAPAGRWTFALAASLLFAAAPLVSGRLAAADRRAHFFSYDFAKNILRAVPVGGTVVAKKDVQLYALWHYQIVQGWRPDVRVVSQGLAGSAWYQAGWRRLDPGMFVGPLRDVATWQRFVGLNGPIYVAADAEIPPGAGSPLQRGLLTEVAVQGQARAPQAEAGALWELMSRRGDYTVEGPDFFTADLIYDYALSAFRMGAQAYSQGDAAAGAAYLTSAWAMHWMLPDCPVLLGYIEFTGSRWVSARRYYALSARLYEATLALADEYHSLEDLKSSLRQMSAEAYVHLGAACERLGEREAAESHYRRSLAIAPVGQAHFNLAVLYWNRDWAKAVEELSEAVRLDPRNEQAAKYLAIARARKR